ncbi:dihydrofolate reductase family protein [Streptomyces meridianus]|uniref:Dihydrofolate reductase family protein n=1 Tax=Streptomyces meridianus TaxID=2938945 RepID=A0ABT0X9R4_9ACTN|nr:dihydrofolate reductase family protein [Streptomyces meridianus]MCM2579268.1 dihydrofolate reductase family protein [Streptomyces meridianus]
MSKLVVSAFMTLDGITQAPGGPDEDREGGFAHGGWSVPYADEDMGRIMVEQFAGMESLLLGRRTYEIFAAHWPRITDENDPVATKLNAMPKYVASRTLDQVEWNNAHLLRGDARGNVAEAVAGLKQRSGGEINVQGSSNLIRTLQQHDLVDAYRLLIEPVVLGTGKRLFAEGTVPAAMKLAAVQQTGSGVLYCTYERAGKPEYGSFELEDYPEKVREMKMVDEGTSP